MAAKDALVMQMPLSRRMWSLIAALALFLLPGWDLSAVSDEPKPSAKQSQRIDRLITQLGDDAFNVREQAQEDLVTIGSPALPALAKAAKAESPERRQRAEEAIRQIRAANVGLEFVGKIQRPDLLNANSAAVSPDGKFLYVSSFRTGSVLVFANGKRTTLLEHIQTLSESNELQGVLALRISPDGKLAVATCGAAKSVVLLARDAETGKLTILDSLHDGEGVMLSSQSDAAFSPDGRFVYSLDRGGAVVVLRITDDNKLELVETIAGKDGCFATACGIAMHPQGTELIVVAAGASALTVLKRNPATGALTIQQVLRDEQEGIHGFGRVYGVCYSADGRFVYTCSNGDHAVTALKFDEKRRLEVMQEFINGKGELENFIRGNEVLVTPDGKSLYATGSESHSLACFDIDDETGKLAFRGTLQNDGTRAAFGDGATGLASTPDGRLIYATISSGNAVSVFRRNMPKAQGEPGG